MKLQAETQQLIDIAKKYRKDNSHIPGGGFVIVGRNGAQGWTGTLDSTANNYMPGVWAIDESGNKYLAIGGNDYDGADSWQMISHDTFNHEKT
ncbi:hypothetical protein [Pseudoalteromonas sp. ASV78]|uniref:hypothetical protein n=1 Tax=Pseudoalteromonas sp. ASV78 TaxID=3397851 RepID=UPI0039FCF29D